MKSGIICKMTLRYLGIVFVIIMFIISANVAADNCNAKTITDSTRTGYIYTGDSRIRRLNLTIGMSKLKDNWVYCKSGMGYNWFVSDSLEKINDTIKEHTEIDRWVIVSAWGVNDLWNLNTYLDRYNKLLYGDWNKCKLYLVSVNPVNGRMLGRYNRISSFNAGLMQFVENNKKKSGGRIFYIDTNKKLISDGFSTIDGLHYTETTNRVIYDTIRRELDITNAFVTCSQLDMNPDAIRTITVKDINSKVKWRIEDTNVAKIISRSGVYKQKVTVLAKNRGRTKLIASSGEIELSCIINVTDKKVLVAYYSYEGNSELVAEYIHSYVGGNLVEIDPSQIYPLSNKKLMAYAKNELGTNARPDISNQGVNFADYNDVYIGFPVWYNHAPRPVLSFLDKCVTDGALVNVFCTSESGETGECISELQELYNNVSFKEGLNIEEDMVLNSKAKSAIRKWIDNI